MTTLRPDVAVIGGGATGLGAAAEAQHAGADVVLIERARPGGDCTWTGCVPSKTMIEHARAVHHARTLGLAPAVDTAAVLAHVRDVVRSIADEEDAPALRALGLTVLEGTARFTAPDELDVDGTRVRPGATIIATGSAPVLPPVPGLAEAAPLTTEDVFELARLPDHLAVLGGGATGLELAQAAARLGTEVTLLEAASRLLPSEEPEAGATLATVLAREGVAVHTGVRVDRVTTDGGGVTVHAGDATVATADRVLVAVGRRPVTEGLDLHRAGLQVAADGTIPVDRRMRTPVAGVLAAGDVTAHPRFTHAGYRMGQIAAHTARSRLPWRFAPEALPWTAFTEPEVGRVGLTEAQAFARWGERAKVVVFPVRLTDRARMAGVTEGLVKLVAAPHPVARQLLGGRLVGATVVCPGGADVLGELALAVRSRTLVARLAQTVHAYPTWSFAVFEAVARFLRAHKGERARPARGG